MDTLGNDFDALLTRGAVAALLAAALWAVVLVAAVVVEARTGGRTRLAERLGCPPVIRLWLLGLVVALSTGVGPAQAGDTGTNGPGSDTGSDTGSSSGSSTGTPTGAGTTEVVLDGLPLPDRPVGAEARHRPAGRATVVVRPGDSLWRIARRLHPGAPEAEVAATVARLHAANRRTIGPDPDLIHPGQRLLATDLGATASTTPSEDR